MTRPLAVLASLVLAGVLAACGERSEPVPATGAERPAEAVDLMLDYLPNPDHAGIYAAEGEGFFRQAGLDVRLRVPSDPAAPLKLLQAGEVDLAISYEPEVLLARDQGADVVAIGAIAQRPLTSLMSVGRDAIRSPEQLRGKTIGTAGIPYQDAYLEAILDRAGIAPEDVRKVDVGFNLTPAMLSRRVDATLGAFWNIEGVELARRGRDPVILRVDEIGVPTYDELVVVARTDDARHRGPLLRRMMLALARGHRAVRQDLDRGLDPLLRANPELERATAIAQTRATVPVFFPDEPGRPFGWLDQPRWRAYAAWMAENDLVSSPEVVAGAVTNEFLPGEGT